MTWGALPGRPAKVLIPEDADDWSPARRRAVLLHELAHVKRWDGLTQLLTQLACALYWPNPLVWLAAHRMLIERERACDDLVLLHDTQSTDYAGHLLAVARQARTPLFAPHAGIAMARRSNLETRIAAILDKHRNRRAMGRLGAAITIALLGAVVVPVAMLQAEGEGEEGEPSELEQLIEMGIEPPDVMDLSASSTIDLDEFAFVPHEGQWWPAFELRLFPDSPDPEGRPWFVLQPGTTARMLSLESDDAVRAVQEAEERFEELTSSHRREIQSAEGQYLAILTDGLTTADLSRNGGRHAHAEPKLLLLHVQQVNADAADSSVRFRAWQIRDVPPDREDETEADVAAPDDGPAWGTLDLRSGRVELRSGEHELRAREMTLRAADAGTNAVHDEEAEGRAADDSRIAQLEQLVEIRQQRVQRRSPTDFADALEALLEARIRLYEAREDEQAMRDALRELVAVHEQRIRRARSSDSPSDLLDAREAQIEVRIRYFEAGGDPADFKDLPEADEDAPFRAGDLWEIRIMELIAPGEEARITGRIEDDGGIHIPVLGDVDAAGLTPSELAQRLRHLLEDRDILREPRVQVHRLPAPYSRRRDGGEQRQVVDPAVDLREIEFGPVEKLVLPATEPGFVNFNENAFTEIDFDEVQGDAADQVERYRELGVDLMAHPEEPVAGVLAMDMVLMPMDEQAFEQDELLGEFAVDRLRHLSPATLTPIRADAPMVHLFRTRQGVIGVLRITDMADDPPDVTIEYRLAEDEPRADAAAEPARSADQEAPPIIGSWRSRPEPGQETSVLTLRDDGIYIYRHGDRLDVGTYHYEDRTLIRKGEDGDPLETLEVAVHGDRMAIQDDRAVVAIADRVPDFTYAIGDRPAGEPSAEERADEAEDAEAFQLPREGRIYLTFDEARVAASLGLRRASPERGQYAGWWQLDGSRLVEEPYPEHAHIAGPGAAFEMAIALSSPHMDVTMRVPEHTDAWYLPAREPGRRDADVQELTEARASHVFHDDAPVFRGFSVALHDEERRAIDLQLGIAAGEWHERARWEFPFEEPTVANDLSDDVRISQPEDRFGRYSLSVDATYAFPDEAARLVVIDTDGNVHTGWRQPGGAGYRYRYTFRNLAAADVQAMVLQTQPYRWVEFRNVSLQPGHETQVEVHGASEAEPETLEPRPLEPGDEQGEAQARPLEPRAEEAGDRAAALDDRIEALEARFARLQQQAEAGRASTLDVLNVQQEMLGARIALAELDEEPDRVLALLRELVEVHERRVDWAEQWHEAGRMGIVNLAETRIDLLEASLRLADVEGDRESAVARLEQIVAARQDQLIHLNTLRRAGRAGAEEAEAIALALRQAQRRLWQRRPESDGEAWAPARHREPAENAALAPGAGLEFRIAPTRGTLIELAEEMNAVGPEDIDPDEAIATAKEALAEFGPDHLRRHDVPFAWLPVVEGAEPAEGAGFITAEHEDEVYLLVAHRDPLVMRDDGEWRITSLRRTDAPSGGPAVAFELDETGAERQGELTGDNIGRPMAVVVDGRIYSVPVIRSRIAGQGLITGTEAQVERVEQIIGRLRSNDEADDDSAQAPGAEPGSDYRRFEALNLRMIFRTQMVGAARNEDSWSAR